MMRIAARKGWKDKLQPLQTMCRLDDASVFWVIRPFLAEYKDHRGGQEGLVFVCVCFEPSVSYLTFPLGHLFL